MSDTTNPQVEGDDAEGHVLARFADDDRNFRVPDTENNFRSLDTEGNFQGADDDDTEGHLRVLAHDDEDDVEGHLRVLAHDDEDDVEGHRYAGPAVSGALDPSGDDVRSAHKM